MRGTRSAQEANLLRVVKDFQKKCNGEPITISFSNRGIGSVGPGSGGELFSITNFIENPQGDRSAADIIAIDGNNKQYSISCKQYNPGNFCGQGLKSFTKENKVMNLWMNQVLGEVASFYKKQTDDALEKAIDYVLNIIRSTPANKPLTPVQKQAVERQWKKAKGLMLPNLYIPIPSGMRKALFECEQLYTGEIVTHYITGGIAANPDEDVENRTIYFNDCKLSTIQEMVSESGMIYIVIRKRRADQFLNITDSRGVPVKDSRKFLQIYAAGLKGGSGRRVQIREQRQLPLRLRNNVFLDNGQKTSRASKSSDAKILEVPLDSVLNSIAAAQYNNK